MIARDPSRRFSVVATVVAAAAFAAVIAAFAAQVVSFGRDVERWARRDLRTQAELTAAGLAAPLRTQDFRRLRDRLNDRHLLFYREMMGSLCLTMMYDIFELHARRDATDTHSDRTAYIVKQFLALLDTGICRTEREVRHFAERLNVSPKYLSATVKRVTSHSVSSFINRATVPILKKKLNDERLSLTQIADQMNFNTLSYFIRYCQKHLGQSPSDYRRSLQPKL